MIFKNIYNINFMKSNIMSETNIEFKSKFEGVFEVSCSANIFDA